MAGKKGRSGRRRTAVVKQAYQVRLAPERARVFNAKVEELDARARDDGAKVSAASVISMLIGRWLDEEGGG